MTARIVVVDGATLFSGDNPWTPVESLGETTVHPDSAKDELPERLRDASIAVTNKVRLDGDLLSQLPCLRMIAVTATGYDCVDIEAARLRGIPVCNVPTYGTDSVAQYAIALLLELCHRIGLHDQCVHDGEWGRRGDFAFWKTTQVELAGLTLGIIGFGRIGRRTGEIASALGMRVLACDEVQSESPGYQPFDWADVNEIARKADVVTLHCNLTESSRGIINDAFLTQMKPTAFLINAARGPLIDEPALAAALNEGRLAGAALDVASSEPIPPDNPLLTAKNCIITPHMAWSTTAARRRMMQTTADNIRFFLKGSPQNVVNGPLESPCS